MVVGGIFIVVNCDLEGNFDLVFLYELVYFGGLDLIYCWKENQWVFIGKLLWSKVNGSMDVILGMQCSFEYFFQWLDVEYFEVDSIVNVLFGIGGIFKIVNYGGNWIFEIGVIWCLLELEFNDIGFLVNIDEINYFFWGVCCWIKFNKVYC